MELMSELKLHTSTKMYFIFLVPISIIVFCVILLADFIRHPFTHESIKEEFANDIITDRVGHGGVLLYAIDDGEAYLVHMFTKSVLLDRFSVHASPVVIPHSSRTMLPFNVTSDAGRNIAFDFRDNKLSLLVPSEFDTSTHFLLTIRHFLLPAGIALSLTCIVVFCYSSITNRKKRKNG